MKVHNEICKETIERFQQEIAQQRWQAVATEFILEMIQGKGAADSVIDDLCKIGHQLVAHHLDDMKNLTLLDNNESEIHPVYGVIIQALFISPQDYHHTQIQFYTQAGDIYAERKLLFMALPYYTRAYYLLTHPAYGIAHDGSHRDQIHQLVKRIDQIEAWLQVDCFLTAPATNPLTATIARGLQAADLLCQAGLENSYL
jgi:hypothetical protein